MTMPDRYEWRVIDAENVLHYGPCESEPDAERLLAYHSEFGATKPYRIQRRQITEWKDTEDVPSEGNNG